jgi:hypothetical protein
MIAVGPLNPAHAGVELFHERAYAVSATFDPAASRDTAVEICRRVDGIPLAIKLAAARTKTLTPVDVKEVIKRLFEAFEAVDLMRWMSFCHPILLLTDWLRSSAKMWPGGRFWPRTGQQDFPMKC